MAWDKIKIKDNVGRLIEAQAPVIVSASRSTDIPAFYSDWLVQRINEGYLKWKNPFNGVFSYVSLAKVRVMVFWSKNPKPMLKHLDFFDNKIKNYYFQFTLNDYDVENLEPSVPNVQSRIETFIKLSERLGKDKVIWRFDPLILTDSIGVDELLRKVERIGDQLVSYTSKFVFSYADIKIYSKVQNNLRRSSIKYQEFNEGLMNDFARGLQNMNNKWNFQIGTCAEKIPLEKYGIVHNKCIDDDLIVKLFHRDSILMEFLKVKLNEPELFQTKLTYTKQRDNKDKGQREACGCIISKDIGEYNTCPHFCEYCYANTSREIVLKNSKHFKENPDCEMIKGE